MDTHHDVSTLNAALVDALKEKGAICTPHVEAAFRAVPRHLSVPEVPLQKAYSGSTDEGER